MKRQATEWEQIFNIIYQIASLTQMDMNLSKLWEIMEDRGAWCGSVHGVTKSQTRLRDRATIQIKDLYLEYVKKLLWLNNESLKMGREFHGCPVVRTLSFHCWGPGFGPRLNLTSYLTTPLSLSQLTNRGINLPKEVKDLYMENRKIHERSWRWHKQMERYIVLMD